MANERRVRRAFASGTLSAAVIAGDTTLSSAQFTALQAIGTDAYMPLILDPGGTAGAAEVVWVTAHAASSSTVTVLRGQEQADGGSVARAHAAGVRWVQAPLPADLGKSPTEHARDLAQFALLGPGWSGPSSSGAVTWTGGKLRWPGRLLYIATGRGGHWAQPGYYEFLVPASGTVITGYGGASNATVDAGGIPIGVHVGLYGIPVVPGGPGGGSFGLVSYTSDFVVPSHWLLIASNTENDNVLKTGWGTTMDTWRALPYANSWATYAGYWPAAAYKDSAGFVHLRGLIAGGAIGGQTTAVTLPVGYRPASVQGVSTYNNHFTVMTNTGPSTLYIRGGGEIIKPDGSNVWVDLASVTPFLAEQ